jgi:hypothetical protein
VCRYLALRDEMTGEPVVAASEARHRAARGRGTQFLCGLRDVRLDSGYVLDICTSAHYHDCVFLEDHHW